MLPLVQLGDVSYAHSLQFLFQSLLSTSTTVTCAPVPSTTIDNRFSAQTSSLLLKLLFLCHQHAIELMRRLSPSSIQDLKPLSWLEFASMHSTKYICQTMRMWLRQDNRTQLQVVSSQLSKNYMMTLTTRNALPRPGNASGP
ncbi:hypothetical protein DL96DRAFT_858443 [Flagelloscypha sp. PMI_526]|nr:hypothetical protein DL96DRAFT_858443 [Flagelloscypha sp. PMI_526]